MKNIPIRIKLLLIVLICLIPMAVLNGYMISFQYQRAVDLELKASEEYAEAISVAFMNYVNKIWHAEYLIGQAILTDNTMDQQAIKDYLKQCMNDDQTVFGYGLVNDKGIVVAAGRDKSLIGMDVSDRDYYQRIINGEEKVISDLLISKGAFIPSIAIARGIQINGGLKGIIVASIDIDKIEMILPPSRLGRTGSFGIIDSNGMIVYRNGSPNIPLEKRRIKDDSPGWKALNGEVAYANEYKASIDGIARIGTNYPISSIGWATFATTTSQEVLQKPNVQTRFSISMMLLILVTSIVIAIYFIYNLIKPIKKLQYAANAISQSDFSVRTNLERKDELGQTGMAFDKMAEHIQKLEESRMLFLQTAAHELRNPMTSVKGITSLIHRTVYSGKPLNNQEQLIGTLNQEVSRLATLLNQILDAFTAERQNIQIKTNIQPVDIRDVVNSAVSIYQMDTTINRKIISENTESMMVLGDFHRLEDVLRNLISNAIKYSPEMTEIVIHSWKDGSFGVVSVRDQGIGIPEDQLTQIFNSFHRIGNYEENDPGGLGLGLYICKDIIIRHGGMIWAENNEDRGSTFYIKVPLAVNQAFQK